MKSFLFALCFCIAITGCTKEDQGKGTPARGEAPESGVQQGTERTISPQLVVRFAEIVGPNQVSSKPLVCQYDARNADGKAIECRYRWYVNGGLVAGVAGNVLEPSYFKRDDRVEVEVIPVEGEFEGRPYRTQPVAIKNSPPVVSSIALSPLPAYPGDSITAAPNSTDWDRDGITYAYRWEVNNNKVDGAVNAQFNTTGLKKKSFITVTITPTDGLEQGQPVRSDSLVLSNRPPEVTSVPPSGLENGMYTYQVSAQDPDGDPLTFSLVNSPEGMTIDRSSGLIRWDPSNQLTDKQEVNAKVAVDDGDGGITYQEFSLFLEMK